MRLMLIALMSLLIATDFLGRNPGLGPGLSAKNALLYVLVMVLAFRMALTGGVRMRMPALHVAWAVWIAYAILTWLAVSLVVHYSGYDPIVSAFALKSELIDYALYCFVAFYGVRNEDDYRAVLRALAAVVGISSILTLTDLVGLTSLGLRVGDNGAEADRVFGAFGHANETGSLLAFLMPMLVVGALSARGLWRLVGLAFIAATAAVFILTVSRGSYLAVFIGYPIAAYMLRHIIPLGRSMAWLGVGLAGAIVGVGVMAIVDPPATAAIADRVLGIGSMGLHEASSGRSDIWGLALSTMMESPLTLLTGFGWNSWSTMPTIFVLHNTYLDQWFNLGVLGLGAYVAIEYLTVMAARRAAAISTGEMRWDMVAYVFGLVALALAVLFQNLYTPRPYLWMYTGLIMRGVVLIADKAAAAVPAPAPVVAPQAFKSRPVSVGTGWRRA